MLRRTCIPFATKVESRIIRHTRSLVAQNKHQEATETFNFAKTHRASVKRASETRAHLKNLRKLDRDRVRYKAVATQ